MIDPAISTVKPDVLNENMLTIGLFLRESYSDAKAHLQHGIVAFKDDFRGMYYKTDSYFKMMSSPDNNFLKNDEQIATEFHQVVQDGNESDNIVLIDIAFLNHLEENY